MITSKRLLRFLQATPESTSGELTSRQLQPSKHQPTPTFHTLTTPISQ